MNDTERSLLVEARNYVLSYIKQDENAGPYESGAKAARDLLRRIDLLLARTNDGEGFEK